MEQSACHNSRGKGYIVEECHRGIPSVDDKGSNKNNNLCNHIPETPTEVDSKHVSNVKRIAFSNSDILCFSLISQSLLICHNNPSHAHYVEAAIWISRVSIPENSQVDSKDNCCLSSY